MHQHFIYTFFYSVLQVLPFLRGLCALCYSLWGNPRHCVSTVNISFSFRPRIRAGNILFNKDLKIQPPDNS